MGQKIGSGKTGFVTSFDTLALIDKWWVVAIVKSYDLRRKPSTVFVHLDILKCFEILIFCTENVSPYSAVTRKSRHTFCADLRFKENENVDTLEKNPDRQK